jgi:hypothetical protein
VNKGTLSIIVAVILILGGFLTIQIISQGADGALPVIIQTTNPEGSTATATTNQAVYFVIFSAVAIGSLIGGGVVLSFVLKFLDREIAQSKGQ